MAEGHGVIEDVAAEIGFTATIKLMVWFGNRTIAIPTQATENHPIAVVIGVKAMARLCAFCGDSPLYVPALTRLDAEHRDQFIALLIAKGISTKTIGDIVELTERRVQQKRRDLERTGLLPLVLSGEIGAKWGNNRDEGAGYA